MKNKTEEVEKLKIELNMLKQALKLENTNNFHNSMEKQPKCIICNVLCKTETDLNNHIRVEHINIRQVCAICNLECESKEELNNHTKSEHKDKMQSDQDNVIQAEANKESIKNVGRPNLEGEIFKCKKCIYKFKSEAQLNNHIKWKHSRYTQKEEEFNCNDCDYQGTSILQLNKHFNIKHVGKNQLEKEVIKCKHCDEQFSEKWNLMNHRKEKHIQTVAYCRKKLEGACPFTDEKCWWSHQAKQMLNPERIECFICGETCLDKPSLMKHRKSNHPSVIRKCNKFAQNNCQFTSSSHWYSHEEEVMEIDEDQSAHENGDMEAQLNKNKEQGTETTPVFRNLFSNIKPPIMKKKKD